MHILFTFWTFLANGLNTGFGLAGSELPVDDVFGLYFSQRILYASLSCATALRLSSSESLTLIYPSRILHTLNRIESEANSSFLIFSHNKLKFSLESRMNRSKFSNENDASTSGLLKRKNILFFRKTQWHTQKFKSYTIISNFFEE